MTGNAHSQILVIGAGSMGLVTGYHLGLAGADVTFLVRPHHIPLLSRPQMLFCYGDDDLKEYCGYSSITEPAAIRRGRYDYIVVTLDAASLQNSIGQDLIRTIGDAARGTRTKIILGTIFFDLRSWFIDVAGLDSDQVVGGSLAIHAYPVKAAALPVPKSLDQALIAQADLAYIDSLPEGFVVEDGALDAATGFAEIYNASGASRCTVKPALECAANTNPVFAIFAACELMGWPRFTEIGSMGEPWSLAVAAFKEIQRLSLHGEIGQRFADATTESALAASLAAWEAQMQPLDLQAFNRYHHGRKVNAQDDAHRRACLLHGQRDGQPMAALEELIQRIESERSRHRAI